MVIQEQGVKHFNCPICNKPDMINKENTPEMYEVLFVNLVSENLINTSKWARFTRPPAACESDIYLQVPVHT